jgi:hypothetical protein
MDRSADEAVADALRAAPNRTPAERLARRTFHRSGRRRRIVTGAGIDVDGLSEHGRRILDWLVDWDEPTIDGIAQLIAARRGSRHGYGPAPRARRG